MNQKPRMKVLITGAAGLLGKGLARVFSRDLEVVPLTRADGDITDVVRMRHVIESIRPEMILHTAAIPDIDECERNPELAWRVNSEATKGLLGIARDIGAKFALISTDSVFDGKKSSPYVESDSVNPLSIYGKTKAAAEDAVRKYDKHWIFRVSVLFGPGKASFVSKVLSCATAKKQYVAARDQLGSATYTLDAGDAIRSVISANAYGTFHVCNQGECTRYELARTAVEIAGMADDLVVGQTIAEMNRIGPRPKYSVMEMRELTKARLALPGKWEDSLREYIDGAGLEDS